MEHRAMTLAKLLILLLFTHFTNAFSHFNKNYNPLKIMEENEDNY